MMNAFIQEHDLFPALPFHTGRLSRDGHDLYFEECGKQTGRPILFLHGGLVLAMRRHTDVFLTQTDFAVFYLISVDLVNLVRLLRLSRTPQNC